MARAALRRAVRLSLALAIVLAATGVRAQLTPQVTSEIPCTSDAQCPVEGWCSWFPGWPGCACDEGAGHCAANAKPCDAANDCFGREVCAAGSGRCTEPGPPEGDACNADDECAPWMSCLLGRCSRGECVLDADCGPGRTCGDRNACVGCSDDAQCAPGSVCRDGECLEVRCVSDDECGPRQVCRDATCRAVECRSEVDCDPCSVCTSENACTSLCRDGEECRARVFADALRFVTFACVGPEAERCKSSTTCPLGGVCLGGRCVDLDDLLVPLRSLEKR